MSYEIFYHLAWQHQDLSGRELVEKFIPYNIAHTELPWDAKALVKAINSNMVDESICYVDEGDFESQVRYHIQNYIENEVQDDAGSLTRFRYFYFFQWDNETHYYEDGDYSIGPDFAIIKELWRVEIQDTTESEDHYYGDILDVQRLTPIS